MEKSGIWQGNESIVQKLKNIPALKSLDDGELRDLLRLSEIHKYTAGETIIEEGAAHGWVFYLISGKVKIIKKGKPLMVLQRGGDVFGEMSALGPSQTTASVSAIEDTVCLTVSIADIDQSSASNKFVFRYLLYREFAEALATRLRITTEELIRTREKLERLQTAYKLAVKTAELEEVRSAIDIVRQEGGEDGK